MLDLMTVGHLFGCSVKRTALSLTHILKCDLPWEVRTEAWTSISKQAATSCNSYLLLINPWSQQVQKTRTGISAKRERQIHADNITTPQPPSQVSTSSVRTQPLSYRGPNVPRDKGINCKTPPIQHDDVGLIYHSFLISALQHKSHEDNAHF